MPGRSFLHINHLWVALILLTSCTGHEGEEDSQLFRRVDSQYSGIDFSNDLEFSEEWNIIEYLYFYNGAGVAAGDVNNDGLIDLFFTSNQGSNKLYLNEGNLRFRDITESAGIAPGKWSTGVVMADVNADGWLDIYVCEASGYKVLDGRNQLYINQHDGTFIEQAGKYGLDFSGLSTHAAFFDFDNDQDLDVYLLNHSVHSVETYGPASIRDQHDATAGDMLFENKLNEGREFFEDVTVKSGIYNSQIGYGLGIRVIDYNLDGWQDIYVSNDFHENDYFYQNMGNGTFAERGEEAFGHTSRYSMGNDAGDINNDGFPEIMSLDMLPADPSIIRQSVAEDRNEVSDIKAGYGYGPQTVRNNLQYNWGDGQFSEIAAAAGVYATDWSWAPLMGDLDNDGWKDIYITNGIAKRPNDLDYIQYFANASRNGSSNKELIAIMPEVRISNYMFRNKGNLTFDDVTREWGLDIPSFSHGSVQVDLDNDGDLDIVVNNVNDEAFLFENTLDSRSGNHHLKIRLKGIGLNTYGIGARVNVWHNASLISGDMTNARGFMSSTAPEIHIGLGSIDVPDSITVCWPGASCESFAGIRADSVLALHQDSGVKINSRLNIPDHNSFDIDSLNLIKENKEFRDYKRESLIPYNLSQEGPAVATGDVNGDGRTDIFIGASHGNSPALWIQHKDGQFIRQQDIIWKDQAPFEDVDAEFFDSDNDGDLDLYIVSGGNQFKEGNFLLRDRLLLNEGTGRFKISNNLPGPALNGSTVVAGDYDGDGYKDLFVGARSVPGAYGGSPQAFLLHNNGDGSFERDKGFAFEGMVTASVWHDLDDDGDMDLILAGDWMPVTIFENIAPGFKQRVITGTEGWWRSLLVLDIDGDGRDDIIAGNMGLNHPLKASEEEPVSMLLADFDNNGQVDPLIFHYREGVEIPFASKDEIDLQIPMMKKKFTSYRAYANAQDIKNELKDMAGGKYAEKVVNTFSHLLLFNKGDLQFHREELPDLGQWTCINHMHLMNDGSILFSGNSTAGNTSLGPIDAVSMMSGKWMDDTFKMERFDMPVSIHEVVSFAGNIGGNGEPAKMLIVINDKVPLVITSSATIQ